MTSGHPVNYTTLTDVTDGARVLDLFAGTGALGIEALLRAASAATFAENGRVASRLLDDNIRMLEIGQETELLRRDATRLGVCQGSPFDLVDLDPPYGKAMGERALHRSRGRLAGQRHTGGLWEENAMKAPPDGVEQVSDRRFGNTYVTLLSVEDA